MNARRYFAHVAESSVSAGRPLAAELEASAKAIGKTPARVAEAIAHAKDGHLGLALERLHVDRLASAVALIRPAALSDAARGLRELPSGWEIVGPVLIPCGYLVVVALTQVVAAALLARTGISATGDAPVGPAPFMAIFLVLVLGGVAVALFRMQMRTAETGGIPGLVLRESRLARLLTAAAVLVRHGVPVQEALTRLAGPADCREADVSELAGAAALDAAALDTLAGWLAGVGRRRARQTAIAVKTFGAGALVLTGLVTVGWIYRSIGMTSGMFFGSLE